MSKNEWKSAILIVILLAFHAKLSHQQNQQQQQQQQQSCPTTCQCQDGDRLVDCNQAGLTQFPLNLPNGTTTLILSRNRLKSLPLDAIAAAYPNLKSLDVSRNQIQLVDILDSDANVILIKFVIICRQFRDFPHFMA